MKMLIPFIMLFIFTSVIIISQPKNGFYLNVKNKQSPWIISQDGQKLFIGEKQAFMTQKCELLSKNNANTEFYLSITIPYDGSIESTTYILIVDSIAYRQNTSGSSQDNTSSIGFDILNEENAIQVSKYLKTPLIYRKHPKHNLLVSFTTTKQEFDIGDEVTVTLRIENVGNNSIAFMKGGRNRAERDNQYIFTAYYLGKQVEDIGTNMNFGGLALKYILNPKEVFEDKISLSKWFSFPKPGMYEIQGTYYLDFQDPDSDGWFTIWEDYISADFIVNIK